MKINYQVELENLLEKEKNHKKKLLIHSCCAPCNSYVLEYLYEYFDIYIYFFNPNINISGEFEKRYLEQERYVKESGKLVHIIKGKFDVQEFLHAIKGHELKGEGSERCTKCFELRLENTAKKALELGMDYFTSSLTISPMKDAELLNKIGEKYGDIYNIKWLPSDFKKKNGYKNSIELSKKYGLYRQDYCGCSFSKLESELRKKQIKKAE